MQFQGLDFLLPRLGNIDIDRALRVDSAGRFRIEEVAYRNGFITKEQLKKAGDELSRSGYGEYLKKLIKDK